MCIYVSSYCVVLKLCLLGVIIFYVFIFCKVVLSGGGSACYVYVGHVYMFGLIATHFVTCKSVFCMLMLLDMCLGVYVMLFFTSIRLPPALWLLSCRELD